MKERGCLAPLILLLDQYRGNALVGVSWVIDVFDCELTGWYPLSALLLLSLLIPQPAPLEKKKSLLMCVLLELTKVIPLRDCLLA